MLFATGFSMLIIGFILGYGVRVGISRRPRADARGRFEISGPF